MLQGQRSAMPSQGVQPNLATQSGQPGQGIQPGQGLPPGHGAPPPGQGGHAAPGVPAGQGGSQPMPAGLAMPPAPNGGQHGLSGPQPGLPPNQQHGLPGQVSPGHRQGPGLPPAAPAGPAPVDPQRGLAQQRQIPAANGLPYPPAERGGPFAPPPGQFAPPPGQFSAPPGQFGTPNPTGGYPPSPYSGPQQVTPVQPPPVAISVGEAVQSAHVEGFGFGEAVARDAPALWLEAVLARKPRMPSDLEARLLQGSALPIDSLLHDEVRHALRRGFWDALERSRH
jgi:hypothetical protein